MKTITKKLAPTNLVKNIEKSLEQIEAITGRNGKDFLQEFQRYVNHKVSPGAVLRWLLVLIKRKQEITVENLAQIRLERTESALRRLSTGTNISMKNHKQRKNHVRSKKRTLRKGTSMPRIGKAKYSDQFYGRPVRSSRSSRYATGISSIVSTPMGGQPPRKKRKGK